jgi:hypothetical protein
MKLTRGKISKIIKRKRQTLKKPKHKNYNKKKSYKKRKHLNLARRTLKKMYKGGDDDFVPKELFPDNKMIYGGEIPNNENASNEEISDEMPGDEETFEILDVVYSDIPPENAIAYGGELPNNEIVSDEEEMPNEEEMPGDEETFEILDVVYSDTPPENIAGNEMTSDDNEMTSDEESLDVNYSDNSPSNNEMSYDEGVFENTIRLLK